MPAPTTTPGRPGWAQALVPTDLMLVGLDGGSPTVVLDVFELVVALTSTASPAAWTCSRPIPSSFTAACPAR